MSLLIAKKVHLGVLQRHTAHSKLRQNPSPMGGYAQTDTKHDDLINQNPPHSGWKVR